MIAEVITWAMLASIVAWLAWAILPMTWWRAMNVRRQLTYLRRHHRLCDHVQDHGGDAWTEWSAIGQLPYDYRHCRACSCEQRREPQRIQT